MFTYLYVSAVRIDIMNINIHVYGCTPFTGGCHRNAFVNKKVFEA